MTSKLTRERIELIANFHRAMTLPPSHDEIEELARIALAGMNGEPVILYRERNPYNGLTTGWQELTENEFSFIKENAGANAEFLTLYRHAQPAPVVPDELLKEYLRLVQCMLSDYRDGNYGNAQRWIRHIAKASDDFERKHGISPWEIARKTCRAAMLAAAPQSPGSEPATVPGEWIPVSERMPETDGNYWGWWSESKRQGPVWFIKSELQAQFQSSEITHWMPLPAAPQEVR